MQLEHHVERGARLRRGGAGRPLRRVGGVGARATSRSTATRSATIPSPSRRSWSGSRSASSRRSAAFDIALHDLQGKLARPAGVPAARAAARGAADDVDDLARRPRRHGAPRRQGRSALQAAEAEARRGGRPRRRARARGAGRRPMLPMQVDVNEGWEPGRGARQLLRQLAPFDVQYCEQPLAGRGDARERGAEARVADSDLRRRELPHARATSQRARSSRTESTSSWRSPAAFARRCAWCTRRARSGSAACSAA